MSDARLSLRSRTLVLENLIGNLLSRGLNEHDRMHRGGLGESPDGLRAYRRNRWILTILALAATAFSWWLFDW